MCEKCNNTNEWKFCPYCGHELNDENKAEMTQEKFDEIFLDLLKKATKVVWYDDAGEESDVPTCNFELRNADDEWMFYVHLGSGNQYFQYSYDLIYDVFNEQYGLEEDDIQRLMQKQLKLLFNMDKVTPYGENGFIMDRVTPGSLEAIRINLL